MISLKKPGEESDDVGVNAAKEENHEEDGFPGVVDGCSWYADGQGTGVGR